MEPGPVCRSGSRPRMLICYLCGREYGSKSLNIHIPQCQRKWLAEEEKKPKNERRPLPPQPNAEKAIGTGGSRAFENFNIEAYAAFEQTLEQCPYCQRRFLPKPFETHQKACTATKPAKPAGTGLIKYSLTNRLVPGSIAGSMHGKAKKQPVPLHLCRPPPKPNPKLKSARRPAWSGAGGSPLDEMEDGQLPHVRHKPSAQEWCLQAETNFSSSRASNPGQRSHKNSLPGSRNSFENRNGIARSAEKAHGGAAANGYNARLVNTFGEIWRAHSREDANLPIPRTHHKSGAAKASSRLVPSATSSPANPRQTPRNAVVSSQIPGHIRGQNIHGKQSAGALQSAHLERTPDFVALAKTLPASKQRAGGALTQAKTSGDLRHHRRSPGFY